MRRLLLVFSAMAMMLAMISVMAGAAFADAGGVRGHFTQSNCDTAGVCDSQTFAGGGGGKGGGGGGLVVIKDSQDGTTINPRGGSGGPGGGSGGNCTATFSTEGGFSVGGHGSACR